MTDLSIDILAKTIFGEARGETVAGQEAIASVILNRVAFAQNVGRYWWGNNIAEVCQKPKQFSCWNLDDPNYKLLLRVTEENYGYCICKRIAMRAVAGLLNDATSGATHYHTKNVRPKWSIGKIPCFEIGNHVFYNDIEGGK